MMKKLLTAAVFAAMTATANGETVTTPMTAGISEQDIEQVKILVAECQKAGLSQKETIQFVAEQIEKKTLADNESMSPMTKSLWIVGTIAALIAIAVIAYKNWPSNDNDKKNNESDKKKNKTKSTRNLPDDKTKTNQTLYQEMVESQFPNTNNNGGSIYQRMIQEQYLKNENKE